MGEGGTLLILGEPGSGKTITLLKLAESLIARTELDLTLPIPVVFNLSSWASKKQTISEWLVQELYDKYFVSKSLSKVWVEEQQLLLLLDGLDEVKVEHRNACVIALNQFMQTHGRTEMVVCSRIQDYEILSERLKLQSAICVQPLTDEQIYQYLKQAGNQLFALKTLLQQDAELMKFAASPLTLSVMSLTYQGCSSEELSSLASAEERQKRLFNNYIERMFQRRKNTESYPKEKTMRWLIWIAQQLARESQTVFSIDNLQPDLLKNGLNKLIFRIINGLNFCLFLLSIEILVYSLIEFFLDFIQIALEVPDDLKSSSFDLLFEFDIWFIVGFLNTLKIKIFIRLKWCFQGSNKQLKNGLKFGIILPLFFSTIGFFVAKLLFLFDFNNFLFLYDHFFDFDINISDRNVFFRDLF